MDEIELEKILDERLYIRKKERKVGNERVNDENACPVAETEGNACPVAETEGKGPLMDVTNMNIKGGKEKGGCLYMAGESHYMTGESHYMKGEALNDRSTVSSNFMEGIGSSGGSKGGIGNKQSVKEQISIKQSVKEQTQIKQTPIKQEQTNKLSPDQSLPHNESQLKNKETQLKENQTQLKENQTNKISNKITQTNKLSLEEEFNKMREIHLRTLETKSKIYKFIYAEFVKIETEYREKIRKELEEEIRREMRGGRVNWGIGRVNCEGEKSGVRREGESGVRREGESGVRREGESGVRREGEYDKEREYREYLENRNSESRNSESRNSESRIKKLEEENEELRRDLEREKRRYDAFKEYVSKNMEIIREKIMEELRKRTRRV